VSRFEQRRKARLDNHEVIAGYREMEAEINLLRAIDAMREQLHISKEQLATRMDKPRPSISRILNDDEANPTLDTITEMLDALEVTADVKLRRRSSADEAPMHVEVEA
jgi:transcriptional regulator with XRE-family HTH domain